MKPGGGCDRAIFDDREVTSVDCHLLWEAKGLGNRPLSWRSKWSPPDFHQNIESLGVHQSLAIMRLRLRRRDDKHTPNLSEYVYRTDRVGLKTLAEPDQACT